MGQIALACDFLDIEILDFSGFFDPSQYQVPINLLPLDEAFPALAKG
jgi:hypothetical protein